MTSNDSSAPQDLEAYYGLPKEVRFCRRCVISNQRPNSAVEFSHTSASRKTTIGFNEEGVCDACLFAERKRSVIDWAERERKLRDLCDRYRRNDGYYDPSEVDDVVARVRRADVAHARKVLRNFAQVYG